MSICKAKKEDAPEILELIQGVLKEHGITDPDYAFRDLEQIVTAYSGSGGEFFIAKHQGKIIGSAGIYRIHDVFAQFRRFYVLEEFRGKGVGRKLLDSVTDFASKNGYHALIAISESSLSRAFDFYLRCGFKVFKITNIANFLVKPIGGIEPDLSELAKRNWIFDWKDGKWQCRMVKKE